MKQFLFMAGMMLVGGCAALAAPFWGVFLYYSFATLRPQHLWDWALQDTPFIRWSLLAGVIAIVVFFIHLSTILRTVRTNKIVGMLIVYAMLITLSVLTAFNPKIAQYWFEEYAKVIALAVIAALVIQHFWQIRILLWMIALSLGYIAFEINHMYITQGGRLDILHQGYGGLDNNGAGALIALGLPFTYLLAVSRVGRWVTLRRVLGALLALAILHAVMMTYSRGAMLAASVGLVWLLIHHRPRIQTALVALALVFAINMMAGQEIRDRFTSTAEFQTDESAQSRLDSWAASWKMIWNRPMLGYGPRNSNNYTHNFGADIAGRTTHNQYLQIAADSGIPAAALYISMLGIGFYMVNRSRRRCLNARAAWQPDLDDEQRARLDEGAAICLSIQTSLLMFSVSAMFLSVELVELPWLLLVLGGITPGIINGWLELVSEEVGQEIPDAPRPPKRFGPAQADTAPSTGDTDEQGRPVKPGHTTAPPRKAA